MVSYLIPPLNSIQFKYKYKIYNYPKDLNYKKCVGKRISRGLFRNSNGAFINADVKAGYNILKKIFPNSVSVDGIEIFGLLPQVINQNIFDIII
jgi:hypothetical protein